MPERATHIRPNSRETRDRNASLVFDSPHRRKPAMSLEDKAPSESHPIVFVYQFDRADTGASDRRWDVIYRASC